MNSKQSVITISLKKPAIRIYKETLHQIGNPSYILLLVNPNDCSLVLFPSLKSDVKAHNVEKYLNNNCKSVVLYSKPLIENLQMLCPKLKQNSAYKFFGEIYKDKNIAKFNINEGIEISKKAN